MDVNPITHPVSIIICTYNRSELLAFCLESLTAQTLPASRFEVVVVNNNSSDDTDAVASGFATKFPHFELVNERRQGLSNARNKGLEVAKNEWVIYLDDDAKAAPDFVERASWMIDQGRYKVFGGIFLPWYKYGRPVWFKDAYASNKKYDRMRTLHGDDFACGGVMAFEKSLLTRYGGFDPALGMSGARVAYGEETEVQYRMRQDGIEIGYDPEWIIYHLVAPYKLNVGWFFKAGFAWGRDRILAYKDHTHVFYLFLVLLTAFGLSFVYALRYTPKLLFDRNYYIENWLIDVFRKFAKRLGTIYTALLENSRAKDRWLKEGE